MLRQIPTPAWSALAVAILLAGCAQSGTQVVPPTDAAVSALPAMTPAEGALLSGFDLNIDVAAGTAELLPLRAAEAIGDTYSELGLAPAFTEMFGRNFEVVGLRHTGTGPVEVDFRITHPFSPAIRPDLGIFNVKAWAISDRTATNIGTIDTVPDLVANADGYGRMWLDTASSVPSYPTATAQPYILMREDLGSAPFDFRTPAGFNVLFPGMTSDATLALNLDPDEQIRLRIYLTADYGQSAVRATRQTPAYELPKFAGNAAWKVAVTELSNDLTQGDTGSGATFQVDIWDWKHGASLGSDVATTTLEIPGVTLNPLTLVLSGTGSDPTPLTGQTLAVNAADAIEGDYWGIVTVTDQATTGVGLLENLTSAVTITSYVTYQLFPVHVDEAVIVGDPPTAILTRSCPGQPVTPGQLISLDATASIPGAQPIVDYEWDYDYDGVTFTIDATGAMVSTSYPAVTTKTIALRVRATDTQEDLATTLVTVLPTATWQSINRLTFTATQRELFDTSQNTSNALSVGPDGKVHLAWFTFLPYQVWHQSFTPSPTPIVWDAPELIYSSGGGGIGHVSCQTGADNVTHVMYSLNSSGRPRQSVSKTTGPWSAPSNVPQPVDVGQWDRVMMVSNITGTMGFIGNFARLQPGSGSGLPAVPDDMYFTTLTSGTWAPLVRIGGADMITSESGGGRVPSNALVATASGEWIAVWENLKTPHMGGPIGVLSDCKLVINQTTAGVWGTSADLYNNTNDYDLPVLARSPNGRIWLGARIGTAGDAWGLATYDGTTWSPSLTQIFAPTGVTFSRLPCTQFAFDSLGRGCLLVAYREPTAPVQAKFMHETDEPATIAACTPQVIEAGLTGVGKPMCQVAAHGDGRFTGIWLTTKYNSGFPYTADTEIEYSTFQ